MKKLVIAFLILALVPVTALAAPQTIDLDTMSYADLLSLRQSVDQAMMDSPEWKGVEVPQGAYAIGTDIPAGKYTIECADVFVMICFFDTEDGAFSYSGSPTKTCKLWSDDSMSVDFVDGTFIRVDNGSVLFKPYTGLGFK